MTIINFCHATSADKPFDMEVGKLLPNEGIFHFKPPKRITTIWNLAKAIVIGDSHFIQKKMVKLAGLK
jgi:hypothetical protein